MTTREIKKHAIGIRTKLQIILADMETLNEDANTALDERPDNFNLNGLVDTLLLATESVSEAVDELEEIGTF